MQENININYEEVFTFDHLYKSYKKCLLGVKWKQSVQSYHYKNLENITRLYNDILNQSYKSKNYYNFKVAYRGKTRDCQSIYIGDRVLQKCLCDYCLVPEIRKKLVWNNAACIKGKGLKFIRNNFKKHLRQIGPDGYVLLIDYKSYFANIRHDILLSQLEKLGLDEKLLKLVGYLLDLYDEEKKGVGLALGSQMSQSFSLLYASEIDNYIYHYKHIQTFGRYMDDTYVMSKSKRKLQRVLANVRKIASKLGITINNKKTKIIKISNGITFLKERYLFKDSKIIVLPSNERFTRMRRKIEKKNVDINTFNSWYGSFKGYRCYHKLKKIKRRFLNNEKVRI